MPRLTPETYEIPLIKIHINLKHIKTRKFMFNKKQTLFECTKYINLLKESPIAQSTKAVSPT
jgi:hypothetical protein